MNAFQIRQARRQDTGEVMRLVRALAEYERLLDQVTATEAVMEEALFGERKRAEAALAWIGDRAVGLAVWYYTFSTFTGGPDLFLEDIFVEPGCRGRGIGFGFFRYLASRAREEKCRRMEWRVLNWNQPAIDFYRRIGARPLQDWTVQQLEGDALTALAE